MTYPHSTNGLAGTLNKDVELAKAAVLYADKVDLVSLYASMMSSLAELEGSGLAGVLGIIGNLGDQALDHLGLDLEKFTPEIRENLPLLATLLADDDFAALMPPEVRNAKHQMESATQDLQNVLETMRHDTGADELSVAVRAGLLRFVDLGDEGLVSTAVQNAAGASIGTGAFADLILTWTSELVRLLEDPTKRVILDPAALDLVQSMTDAGMISIDDSTVSRSRPAHLGAGFIGRLPAFPDAPFDELLDLRRELSSPLTRYRGAMVRMSRSLTTSPFAQAITEEADDLWTAEVAPALADIEDALTDHGLVRELGRRARVDARDLVIAGSGLLIGLEDLGKLSTIVSGAVAAAGVAAGVVGPAMNDRKKGNADASRGELYYLYRLGSRGSASE